MAVGVAVTAATPATWGLGPGQGLLFGGALYAGGLRRYLAGAGDGAAMWRRGRTWGGAAMRVGAFLGFAALQALACFEWLPGMDLRWTFVVFSSWVTIETLLEPRTREGATAL
jgi:hypothetical protein